MLVRFGCGLLLAVLGVVATLAVVYLPTWAAGVTIAACLVAAGVLILRGLRWLFNTVFEAKSKALGGARVTVHAVEKVARPSGSRDRKAPEPAAGGEGLGYLVLDVTVTPLPEVDLPWEPHELLLVPFERDVSAGAAAADAGDDPEKNRGSVYSARLIATDGQTSPAPDHLSGEQRLRLVFACPPTLNGRVKLQYYFASMGDFRIE